MNAFMKFTEASSKECKLSELVKENPGKTLDYKELDTPMKNPFHKSHLPKTDGEWSGERGDSKWIPNPQKTPDISNPDGLTWEQILKKHDIDGIEFKDGEPDFSRISRGTVEIEDFSLNRDMNYVKADEAEAQKRGCLPDDVEKWRKENNYAWHERKDCRTMDKVPSEVHNNIPHAGGISEKNKEDFHNNEVQV